MGQEKSNKSIKKNSISVIFAHQKAVNTYKNSPREVRAAFWFTVCSFLQKGISELSTPIFTRILTTEEYGQFSVFNTWLNFATVIVVLKLFAGVYTQGLVKYESDQKTYVSSMQGLSLSLTLLWTIIYLVGKTFWNNLLSLTTTQMLCMLIMIWASSCFNLWATQQRVLLKYRKLIIITIVTSIAKPVIGVTFVILSDDKVTARILGLALVELLGYSWCFFVAMKSGKHFFSAEYWKITITACIPLIPHYLCQTALNSADRIMIKQMIGVSEAGIYSLAYSISQIVMLLNTALVQTVSPWIGKKIKQNKTEEVGKIVYISLILVGLANIILIAFAPEIVRIFSPKSYYDAIWVIPPIAMSVYFQFMYSCFAAFEFYFNETKQMSLATTLGAVLNIGLNYVFLQKYGYYAAGYTTLICYIMYAVFHFVLMKQIDKKYIKKASISGKTILLISTLFVFLGLIYLLTYANSMRRFILTILLFVIIFFMRDTLKKFANIIKNQ